MSPADAQLKALQLKRDFAAMQREQERELDELSSALVKKHNAALFKRVAAEEPTVRTAAGLQDWYDEWSFAYADNGEELPLADVPQIITEQESVQRTLREQGERKGRKR